MTDIETQCDVPLVENIPTLVHNIPFSASQTVSLHTFTGFDPTIVKISLQSIDMNEWSNLKKVRTLTGASRTILYRHSSCATLYALINNIDPTLFLMFRENISCSEVLVFSKTNEEADSMLFMFVEFSPNQLYLVFDVYQLTITEYNQRVQSYHDSLCSTFPLFVVLDIDKTLSLTYEDCKSDQHLFTKSFDIHGRMTITGENFSYKVMLRKGIYDCLRRIQRVATIYVLTAGDIHYGRAIINAANKMNWGEPEKELISIDLLHVFSVRNTVRKGRPKQFNQVLPFMNHYKGVVEKPWIAVDDDPNAWDIIDRSDVLPITPLQPGNNHESDLTAVADYIELKASRCLPYLKI